MLKKLLSAFSCHRTQGASPPSAPANTIAREPAAVSAEHVTGSVGINLHPAGWNDQGLRPRLMQELRALQPSMMTLARRSQMPCLDPSAKAEEQSRSREIALFISQRLKEELSDDISADRVNLLLSRVSDFLFELESQLATPLRSDKLAAKRQVFSLAIERAGGKTLDAVEPFRSTQYFRDQNRVLIDVARKRMLDDVQRHFQMPDVDIRRAIKRIRQKDLPAVSQGEYVTHVSNLFNLENRLSRQDLDAFVAQLCPRDRARFSDLSGSQAVLHRKVKDVIPFLLSCFPVQPAARDFTTRNTHPASLLLQQCCGMVFHPSHSNKALTDSKSPYAFENIGMTLAFKFFEAEHHGRLPQFYEQAFVVQQPCYEAVSENLMNFQASAKSAEVIFHPRPDWNAALSDEENINGMLAWVQREMLAGYARREAIDVDTLDLKTVNALESSSAFASYLLANEPAVAARLRQIADPRITDGEVARFVHDDLVMGISVA